MQERNAAAIWKQNKIPVIYRQGSGLPLMIKLPYSSDNFIWLRSGQRRKPDWLNRFKCWEIPNSWFNDVVKRSLLRFRKVFVVQPYRAVEKCAPACWTAQGFECECSCMGANHGSQNPGGSWRVISETFAMRWHDRDLACRLIEMPPDFN
jgi:hypothetical protein